MRRARIYISITMTTLLTGAQVVAAKMDTPSDASLESQASRTGPPTTDTKQSRSPFAAGRWLLSGYGSAAVGTGDRVYAGHAGLGYYFIDNISLNLEGVGYFIEHANTTGGGGLDLVPRWHYLKRDHWSLYLDGGMGFIYTRDSLRDPGTRFNFTLQGGAGATYDVTDRFTVMGGARWSHISNAGIQGPDRNVGFDSPMFYLGLMPW